MSWTPLGKAGDLTGRHLAPSPSVHPSPGLQRQRAPRRPGGAAQPPSRSAARRPPPSPPGRGVPVGGGARAAGGGRGPGEGPYLCAASVRRSCVCCWDCGAGEAPTDSNRATPRPSPLRWPRARAPGPGDRRRAGGRRQLLWGAAGRGRLPGPAWRGLGSDYLEEQRRSEKAPRPPRRDLALNLNLYLTFCPEGGEGTHLSWDGSQPSTAASREGASPPSCAREEAGRPQGPLVRPKLPCVRVF